LNETAIRDALPPADGARASTPNFVFLYFSKNKNKIKISLQPNNREVEGFFLPHRKGENENPQPPPPPPQPKQPPLSLGSWCGEDEKENHEGEEKEC
jgi:hypothetical protein